MQPPAHHVAGPYTTESIPEKGAVWWPKAPQTISVPAVRNEGVSEATLRREAQLARLVQVPFTAYW